jgi:hypothetical protein
VPTSASFRLLPLSGLICALSGFRGNTRHVVQHTIEMLGGKFTPALSLVTSHLICASENSDKYRHCVKQPIEGRKVLSLEWLALCVELGMRVGEAEFAFTGATADDAVEHPRLTLQLELALMADTDGVRARRHGLFVGKYFATHGLADAARTRLRRQLAKLGGTLLKPDPRAFELAHYIVCGHGVDRPRVPSSALALLVSETWIAGCLNSEALLPIRDCIAFTPMTCRVPLAGASAVLAHITGRDKLALSLLAGTLGMQVSDIFDRSTTHLVVHRRRVQSRQARRRAPAAGGVRVRPSGSARAPPPATLLAAAASRSIAASIVGPEIAAAAAAAAAAVELDALGDALRGAARRRGGVVGRR